MNRKLAVALILALVAAAITVACDGGKAATSGKTIKSANSNGLTITLASDTGEIKSGNNDLYLIFADEAGKAVDVGAASLKFHMPAMGLMAEMNDVATLTTTDTPGRYRARVHMDMAGTWEAMVNYQGAKGTGQAMMSVNAK
ncbi:MAG TPA: FixH family protein [Blastocatellia bacterium]|nr:FixH family protein [Blastocatellia bacterium]